MKDRRGWTAFLFLLLAGAAHASLPAPARFVAQVVNGKIDPERFDFSEYWRMTPAERTQWYRAVDEGLTATLPTNGSRDCATQTMRGSSAGFWLRQLGYSRNEADWSARAEKIRTDLARIDEFVTAAEARLDLSALEPRVAELFRRQARSNAIEQIWLDDRWQVMIPPPQSDQPMNLISKLWLLRDWSIECANAQWLREQMKEIGWFVIPQYGAAADLAAWHLLDEADLDRALQYTAVEYLESLPPGSTASEPLAELWDFTAVGRGKPFRYGMEGWCWPDGTWRPRDVEDPANLDARRAAKGLKPIAEFAAEMAVKHSCKERAE